MSGMKNSVDDELIETNSKSLESNANGFKTYFKWTFCDISINKNTDINDRRRVARRDDEIITL